MELYAKYAPADDNHDGEAGGQLDPDTIIKVTKQMEKEGYYLTEQPPRAVKHAIQRWRQTGSVHDAPRSGRPTDISKVGTAAMDKVCDALEAGRTLPSGEWLPYSPGSGLYACPEARSLMKRKGYSPRKLLRMCKQHRPELTTRTVQKRIVFTLDQKADRERIARERLAMPAGWQQRVFMLDATSKTVSRLVRSTWRAIVNRKKDRSRKIVSDPGLGVGGKNNGAKFHWMVMINILGGAGPLTWLTGTFARKGKRYKVRAALMLMHS